MTIIVWKILFLLSRVAAMIPMYWKNVNLIQKSWFCQKTTNNCRWKLFRVNDWSKLNMKKIAYTKLLNLDF